MSQEVVKQKIEQVVNKLVEVFNEVRELVKFYPSETFQIICNLVTNDQELYKFCKEFTLKALDLDLQTFDKFRVDVEAFRVIYILLVQLPRKLTNDDNYQTLLYLFEEIEKIASIVGFLRTHILAKIPITQFQMFTIALINGLEKIGDLLVKMSEELVKKVEQCQS